MASNSKQDRLLGQKGEDIACQHLIDKGLSILERNFRCKMGEIDLICQKDEFLVFVEVKTRKPSKEMIHPLISLTRTKCSRLRRLGEFYRVSSDMMSKQPRFDAIGIIYRSDTDFTLEHIENAF